MSASEFPVYKPSVFYFRKALDESRTTAEAIKTALIVCAEFEYLRQWSMERGVLPAMETLASMDCLRRAIREERSHGQVVVLGLYLCHELEQLKAAVRAAGLQPPKWIVAPEEAAAKGWEDRSGLAMDF